jgi:CheY-like chemotaxis protein/predicted regulator of Ras-like GTPase activity (Roadblock/LC7/MglB family)
MSSKRVLIVDDDKDILRMLEFSLKKLGPDYQIITAKDTVAALNMVEKQPVDLVVVDYMMPGITGIDLARAVRQISPGTQVVVMTAYGTTGLRNTAKYLGLDGYIDKPFTLEQIREIVKRAVDKTHQQEETPTHVEIIFPHQSIRQQLESLQANTGARCVLLLSSDGYLVQVVGETEGMKVSSISALVAANFIAAAELANLLGNRAVFKSSYHEGEDYNIYAYDVNMEYLLAVVFDAKRKPGAVWFYTKQTVVTLGQLMEEIMPARV